MWKCERKCLCLAFSVCEIYTSCFFFHLFVIHYKPVGNESPETEGTRYVYLQKAKGKWECFIWLQGVYCFGL